MKFPALGPTLLFSAGVGAAVWWGGRLEFLVPVCVICLLFSAGWRRLRLEGFLAALFFLGWTYHLERLQPHSPFDLRREFGTNAELVTIVGEIAETPTFRLAETQGPWVGRTLVPVEVHACQRSNTWLPSIGTLMVTTPGVLPRSFFRGQRVHITGVLNRPPGPDADGLFDYRAYLLHQGIWFTLRTESPDDWRLALVHRDRPPLSERFLPWAQSLLTQGLPDDEATRLLVAMALGWKTPLAGEINDIFMRSGTMHVFAISGLHIGLIAGILVELLRLFRLSRGWCGWVAIPLVWFYVDATGWQASAIRSAIMSSVIIAGWALQRPGQLLNSLAISGWIILVWDPGQLFQASFQLSFAAVAGLAILGPPLQVFLESNLRLPWDTFLPANLKPRWHGWINTPLRLLASALAIGLASLIASLPLTVHWFHLFNPVSLLANLVVVPLSSLALAANFASVLTGPILPILCEYFNAAAWVLMNGMVTASEWAARLPGGHFWTESPPWLWWLAYYWTVLGCTQGWFITDRRRHLYWALLASATLGATWSGIRHRAEIRMALLKGDGLVQSIRGQTFVLEGGNERTVQRLTIPYLRAHGVQRLAGLAATGESAQQIGGVSNLLAECHPQLLWLSSLASRSAATKRGMAAAESMGIPIQRSTLNSSNWGWTVLHPDENDRFTRGEDRSMVLSTSVHGFRVLWLGELGRPGQRAWLERGVTPCDLLISEVPPNSEPVGSALLEALHPQVLVVMSDHYPATRRVKPPTRERFNGLGIRVIYTEDVGSVLVRFHADGVASFSGDGWEFSVTVPSAASRSSR